MTTSLWPALAATLGAGYLLLGIVVLAARRPGYSHLAHTISELGERGAPQARAAAWGLFVPVGALCLAVAGLAPAASAGGVAICLAIGYLGAALFPCDPGAPLVGSWRQQAHSFAGAVEYVGGAAFLSLSQTSLLGVPSALAGATVLACGLGLSWPGLWRWRGLVQRIAEFVLFGGLIVLSATSG